MPIARRSTPVNLPRAGATIFLKAICISVAVSSYAAAQGTNVKEVTVDLTSPVITQVVPFDVPIALVGNVSTAIPVLYGSIALPDAFGQCVFPTPLPTTGPNVTMSPATSGLAPATKTSADTRAFRLEFGPLQYGRRYCFFFWGQRPLIAEELKQFQTRATRALNQRFDQFHAPFVTNADLIQLQASLRTALDEAVRPFVLDPQQVGPLQLPLDANRFFPLFRAVVNPQQQVLQELQNVYGPPIPPGSTLSGDALQELQAILREGAPFRVLLKNLADASANSAIADKLKTFGGFIASCLAIGRTDQELFAFGTGLAPGVVGSPGVPNWQQFDLAPQITELGKHIALLDNSAFWATVKADKDLLTAGQIDAAGLEQIRQGVQDALAAVDGVFDGLSQAAAFANQRSGALDAAVKELVVTATERSTLTSTTVGNFSTRSNWYLSADLGVASAAKISQVFPYIGVNFYTRPVNKDAPLRGWDFRRRFAFMVGVTFDTSLVKSNERDNLFGGRMAVVGAGIRLKDFLRLSAGFLLFKGHVANPTVDRFDTVATPFVSLSIDWDIVGTVTGWFKSDPTKK